MNVVTYSVPSMHCDHCVHTIEMELSDLAGVDAVKANLDDHNVTVTFAAPASEDQLKATLTEINYPVAA